MLKIPKEQSIGGDEENYVENWYACFYKSYRIWARGVFFLFLGGFPSQRGWGLLYTIGFCNFFDRELIPLRSKIGSFDLC
jgi:hypothetical protein